MASLLNLDRPPVFCPGCAHERVVQHLDQALQDLGVEGTDVVIVTDIGCSGLFDTFFHTHAFHGLHGRALTYAAGLKLARPDLQVVVTMGDGGIGIGGAHFLAACKRNLDLTLLVLNNFNFGMTGGQFSATTPAEAAAGSSFLNRLERPLDICSLAAAAGAPFVTRTTAHGSDLAAHLLAALRFPGFAVLDIQGVCPGRFTRNNQMTPRAIEDAVASLPPFAGVVAGNDRPEYGRAYREMAATQTVAALRATPVKLLPPERSRHEILILGAAGQRIQTCGDLLGLAALSAGLQVTQKNEYDITVLRGPSVCESIVAPDPIEYTGIRAPTVVLALAPEGVSRRAHLLRELAPGCLVVRAAGVDLPPTAATVATVDFRERRIGRRDWALAALGVLAQGDRLITEAMLGAAVRERFSGTALESARQTLHAIAN